MQAIGVALGTIIAQAISVLIFFVAIKRKKLLVSYLLFHQQ